MASELQLISYAVELYCYEEMPTDEGILKTIEELQREQMLRLNPVFALPPSVISTTSTPNKSILRIQVRKN
jgi:hypothetical protein